LFLSANIIKPFGLNGFVGAGESKGGSLRGLIGEFKTYATVTPCYLIAGQAIGALNDLGVTHFIFY